MFDGSKRGTFVGKHSAEFNRLYGGEIMKLQLKLAQVGWPVNDFIDWFIAANSHTMSFCEFMATMRMWALLDDTEALEKLGRWSQTAAVRAADSKSMVGWLGAMIEGARET